MTPEPMENAKNIAIGSLEIELFMHDETIALPKIHENNGVLI